MSLRLQGKDVAGYSEVVEDDLGVIEGIHAFIEHDPRTARMFGVKLGASGQLDEETLRQVASARVIVRTTIK